MAEITITPLNTEGTKDDIIAALRKENAALVHDFHRLKQAAEQLLAEKNARIETMQRQSAEDAAWMKVAQEEFRSVDAYLRSVDPSLPKFYGSMKDGVRKVVQALQMHAGINACDAALIGETDCGIEPDADDSVKAPYGDPTANPYP